MNKYLYLSLMPKILVASQLSPKKFGNYYTVGAEYTTKGPAASFEIDPEYRDPFLRIDKSLIFSDPYQRRSSKRSISVGENRITEHIPLKTLGKLYLMKQDKLAH